MEERGMVRRLVISGSKPLTARGIDIVDTRGHRHG
jgi:hypothetical protein